MEELECLLHLELAGNFHEQPRCKQLRRAIYDDGQGYMLPKERVSNEEIMGDALRLYRGSGEVGTGRSRGSTSSGSRFR